MGTMSLSDPRSKILPEIVSTKATLLFKGLLPVNKCFVITLLNCKRIISSWYGICWTFHFQLFGVYTI